MQDKETVDDAEEALTCKAENTSDRLDAKEPPESRKDSIKDGGKFAFKRMKQPKKEKAGKNSPSRFEGEGIVFKAKLIGLESVSNARGDKMCQDAMQKLKQNVRNTGPHKKKINVCVSLQGIKIKDEKLQKVIYHHPVSFISFISQDITDARAFGYVFGSTEDPHQFIAIKTEKPAFHVVVALRDLFQTVLNHKQEEMDNVKEKTSDNKKSQKENKSEVIEESKQTEGAKPKDENIYFEVFLNEPMKMNEDEVDKPKETEPVKSVDELLGLQNEMNKLQEGIIQMDTSIAAAVASSPEVNLPESDPFDTSFVLGPKRDSFALPMPTPVPLVTPVNEHQMTAAQQVILQSEDKYAVFNAIDSSPSVFETTAFEQAEQNTLLEKEPEEAVKKVAPAKPPRLSKTSSPDLSLFADLDPLGKDRPYKDKTEFFQDVKNPPKKVLNDLFDPNKDPSKTFDVTLLTPSVPFPVDFDSNHTSVNPALSSSLPNSFYANTKMSIPNGDALQNPFDREKKLPKTLTSRASEPLFPPIPPPVAQQNGNAYLGRSPPSNAILASNYSTINNSHNTSSPIPIPARQPSQSLSNGDAYSKSPINYNSDSPNHADYFLHNHLNSENHSPNGLVMKNELNGDIPPIPSPTNYSKPNSKLNSHNGVSRPRPRPSLSKVPVVSANGHSQSSHSLSSDSSSDYEAISRENMQSITNILLTSSHRLRAQSLCLESDINKNIFAKKNDPFADDFFFSLPKKAGHLTKTEIPDYV